jgi:hypothetical protein
VVSLGRYQTCTDTVTLEFRKFVHETEKELHHLFQSIDYNRDGKISKDELRSALRTAGLTVPNSNLDKFFSEVDTNNDGHISFEEWRYVLFQFVIIVGWSLHWQHTWWKCEHTEITWSLDICLVVTQSRDVLQASR